MPIRISLLVGLPAAAAAFLALFSLADLFGGRRGFRDHRHQPRLT
jgi:hypothetical protein